MKKYFLDGCFYSRKVVCALFALAMVSSAVSGCGGMQDAVSGAVAETGEETADAVIISAGDIWGETAEAEDAVTDAMRVERTENAEATVKDEMDAAGVEDATADETGAAGKEDAAADTMGTNETGDVTIIRRDPVKVKGIYVSGPAAGTARMDTLIDLVDQTELNAMVIDIKNDEGRVTYDMQSEQVAEIDAGVNYIKDIDELVSRCKEKDIYLIARIVSFRDPYLAEQKPEWAVHTKDGGIFRDKSGLAWVNPYQREVWDYLAEIALQAGEAGFDEVQFDYIRFSTDIRESEVDYGEESEKVDKTGIITEFTEYMYDRLAPQGIYVAADVFGTVIDNATDQAIVGQDYVQMARHLDYICPMVYPSHYYSGSYGIPVPDAEPYQTIYAAASSSVQELKGIPENNRAHVRLWIQGFTAGWVPGHISYGREQIRAQAKGAYDAGYDEWIVWNAAVNYRRDAFLTDEEAKTERQQWEIEKQTVTGSQEDTGMRGIEKDQKDMEEQGIEKQQETVSGNG